MGKMLLESILSPLGVQCISREKVITTLQIYQYQIFHHTVIETCFEMLKSTEHEKL